MQEIELSEEQIQEETKRLLEEIKNVEFTVLTTPVDINFKTWGKSDWDGMPPWFRSDYHDERIEKTKAIMLGSLLERD